MIDDVVSGWLYARSESLDFVARADLTLVVPTRTGLKVYAEIMLTAFSQGGDLKKGVAGTVGSRVVRGTVMGQNGLDYVVLPLDLACNSAYFDDCLAVDFRLGCTMAEAYANANVWYYGKPEKKRKPLDIVRLHIDIVDRKTGTWHYSHDWVGPRKKLPAEAEASRMVLAQAAELTGLKASALAARVNERERVLAANAEAASAQAKRVRARGNSVRAGQLRV